MTVQQIEYSPYADLIGLFVYHAWIYDLVTLLTQRHFFE